MCGIYGYIGPKNSLKTCLLGLKQLEHRGYDSAGIAGISNGELVFFKGEGKISQLEKKIALSQLDLSIAIGHTRWATHGKPCYLNAHPHFDEKSSLALVHNGIIENYVEIKESLQKKGVIFQSETDTEVLPQLIAHYYKKNILEAIRKCLAEIKGSFAVALIHKDYPGQIFCFSRHNPLCIGYNDNMTEVMIASDTNAFLGYSLNVIYLNDDEISTIDKGSVHVYDTQLKMVQKQSNKFEEQDCKPTKEGFSHFMEKEIFEQSFTIKKAMKDRILDEFGTAHFENLTFSSQELLATRHILIIACGTSYHAGCIGALMLEDLARIPTHAEIASELRYKDPIISDHTLVIAISQSGETADTIAAVKEAKAKGAKVLCICNVNHSTLSRLADSTIFLKAGPEISVCSTKAFTSQITVISLFALLMARLRHIDKQKGQVFLKELKQIPDKVKEVLAQAPLIEQLARKYCGYKNFFFLGRSYMYPTCQEAALKLKEISYLNATAYPGGELKHGPIALIDSELPTIAFLANQKTFEKMQSNLMEIKARQGSILAFVPKKFELLVPFVDDKVILPNTIDELATFLSSIAAQLFAFYMAVEMKTDIDQPKNLAKSVTVE